jgi:alpha-tubulin suppressor-like RCC1 family protein
MWTFGANDHGQLGAGNTTPLRVIDRTIGTLEELRGAASPVRVARVVAGTWCSFFVTTAGDVYSCGANQSGHASNKTLKPAKLNLKGSTVTDLVAGANNVLATTVDGGLLAWGDNAHGELFTNDRNVQKLPTLIDLDPMQNGVSTRTVSVAVGTAHAVVVSEGNARVFGVNAMTPALFRSARFLQNKMAWR